MRTLALPENMDKRLNAIAANIHLSKKTYALRLLEESLEDQEIYRIALERSERIAKGIAKTISLEEMIEKYREKHGSEGLDF